MRHIKLLRISDRIKKYIFLFFTALPLTTYASNLGQVTDIANRLVGRVFYLIMALATIAFLWGIVKYLFGGDDKKQREESKKFMLWGIVGLTVMVSVWSLVAILANIFGMHIPANFSPTLPVLQIR